MGRTLLQGLEKSKKFRLFNLSPLKLLSMNSIVGTRRRVIKDTNNEAK